ncbi:TPA: hypothetical protein KOX39_003416 [Clostridioides difficile]|nr:hypothetical protein [Clostridioides difficile]
MRGNVKEVRDKKVRDYFDRMSISEFLSVMGQEKYKPVLQIVNYRDPEVKKMEDRNYVLATFSDVVYEYLMMWDRIPTPTEYAKYCVKLTYDRLEADGVFINTEVKKALFNRRVNSYVSFITEIYTRKLFDRLLSSKYSIVSSNEMDFKGVDIVVKNRQTGKCAYIHVTSNTAHARERALQKANKHGRDFTGHIWLYYDKKTIRQSLDHTLPELSTDTTKEYNGYYFFKKDYIKERIELIEYRTK